jgi:hypothetical protein
VDDRAHAQQGRKIGERVAVGDEHVSDLAGCSLPRSRSRPHARAPFRVAATMIGIAETPASVIRRISHIGIPNSK